MTRPSPDPAVVALARDVERLTKRIAELAEAVGEARRLADAAHRVLPELTDRVAAVADASAPDPPPAGLAVEADTRVPSWLTARRPEALDRLVRWIDQVLVHYPGTTEALGQCWQNHPWIVEELLALRAAWRDAYVGEHASGTKAVDWHDRHRAAVMARIAKETAGCSPEAHLPGGRLADRTPSFGSTPGAAL